MISLPIWFFVLMLVVCIPCILLITIILFVVLFHVVDCVFDLGKENAE